MKGLFGYKVNLILSIFGKLYALAVKLLCLSGFTVCT